MSSEKHLCAARSARIPSLVEDALFEADDEVVLAAQGMIEIAQTARAVLAAAVGTKKGGAVSRPVSPRRTSRRGARRGAPQRTIVRMLLVANPRARDIVGKTNVEGMTDAEIEAALERLTEVGMLP
jgi:hypothetical protein